MPAMTNLLRAPSGTYFYRRVVPERLRAAVGKGEIKISLKTKDVEEAMPDQIEQMVQQWRTEALREVPAMLVHIGLTPAERAKWVAAQRRGLLNAAWLHLDGYIQVDAAMK